MEIVLAIIYLVFLVTYIKLINKIQVNRAKFIGLISVSFAFQVFPAFIMSGIPEAWLMQNFAIFLMVSAVLSILSILIFSFIFTFLLPRELYKQDSDYIKKRAKRIRNGGIIILANVIANILFMLSFMLPNFIGVASMFGMIGPVLNILAIVSFFDIWFSLYRVRKNLNSSATQNI